MIGTRCGRVSAACAMFCFVLGATSTKGNSGNSDAKNAEADALIEKALALSDVRAPGSPPFELRGTISIPTDKGATAEGTYVLTWATPDQWREEIHFSNYSRVRVGGKSQYWQVRSIDYELLPIYDFWTAFNFADALRDALQVAPGEAKFAIKKRKVDGNSAQCAGRGDEQFCFDAGGGFLEREEKALVGIDQVRFSSFTSFGGKLFPGTIQLQARGGPNVQFRLGSILPLGKVDSGMFSPPSDSIAWANCTGAGRRKLVHDQAPYYPDGLRRSGVSGSVSVYAVIGTDGVLHNMRVLKASNEGFVPSALGAFSGWRYAPETCSGTPQQAETVVSIFYDLE